MLNNSLKDIKCPLCGGKHNPNDQEWWKFACINGCFKFAFKLNQHTHEEDVFAVCGKIFVIYDFMPPEKRMEILEEISREVNYWKENDRYLIEIIERSI